ncbi:Putative rossmann-like alpha/beta/alpha sandwich protein [Colletotrichum destructivum]|uniref:Rossmann-like alpha/beta/alpha sandwich protein n=1 Tax=Colletotrichum destructivum TaxID=34406 RepID=A0AAX4HVW4_9PEZI|nr:Putative rossmann-like alpha/beta/alpha sandwich protein [Colletotrichum destructivum]
MAEEAASAVNSLAGFLAHEQISNVEELNRFFRSLPHTNSNIGEGQRLPSPTDAIVFCASSVLSLADNVFSALSKVSPQSSTKLDLQGRNTVLVLCGGVGHSTPYLYDAIAKHEVYNAVAKDAQGKAESRVLQLIAERWFDIQVQEIGSEGAMICPDDRNRLLVVVEDQSTNCGGNALESRRVLEACGVNTPRSIIVVQDPTMSRRTVATFEKEYQQGSTVMPRVMNWPTFTPKVTVGDFVENSGGIDILSQLTYVNNHPGNSFISGLWEMERFVDLLLGEIPRLRNNTHGYGPKGKGFIVHVDIPERIEHAWKVLHVLFGEWTRNR